MLILFALFASLSAIQTAKINLGRLGLTLGPVAIYAKPSATSKELYNMHRSTYVVVDGSNGGWSKILLTNGAYGYSPSDKIAVLPYNVDGSPSQPPTVDGLSWIGKPVTRQMEGGGFVKFALAEKGIQLPANLDKQVAIGHAVKRLEDLKKGDRLYFWDKKADALGFAGIFIGNGYFVGPAPGEKTMQTHYLGEKKWLDRLVAARR